MQIKSQYYGFCSYQKGLQIQAQVLQKIATTQSLQGQILGFEHKPCISLGVRSLPEDVLPSLAAKWPCVKIPRGGGATLHSPGQLIIYPLVKLRKMHIGPRPWVQYLLHSTQSFLQGLGINSFTKKGQPGLYTRGGKIVFVGLKISQGISQHGLAINIKNNLKDFQHIRACCQKNLKLDSVASHTNKNLNLKNLFHLWTQKFMAYLDNE